MKSVRRHNEQEKVPSVTLVLTTVPNSRVAHALIRAVLEVKLAACASVIPGLESHYVWKGRREKTREWAVLFKTTPRARAALFRVIRSLHPYEVPEILSWKSEHAWPDYARWVTDAVPESRLSAKKDFHDLFLNVF